MVDLSYTVTVAVAGLFAGPLLFAPLARVIGRTSLIFWSLLGALSCQVWAAKMTYTEDYIPFIISRLLAGMFATVPTIFGPSYAVDIFFLHQRGKAFISYEISFLGGVVAGPTIGGFIVESKPWPYTFWWTIAPVGIAMVFVFCFLEETGFRRVQEDQKKVYQPTSYLKNRMATFFPGNKIIQRRGHQEVVGFNIPFVRDILAKPFCQINTAMAPFIIAVSPVVIVVGLYSFVTFGFSVMINILLTVFLQTPVAKGGYGFSPLQNAACECLKYLSFIVAICLGSLRHQPVTFNAWMGIIVAQAVGWSIGDTIPLWASRRFGHGVWRPEYRLWNIILPGLVSPIGLGIFGAALQYHLHFMVLALGLFLVVFGATISVPICINYATECFLTSANEVAVAMNMYRLGFSIALGFFIFPWESAVGVGWVFGMAALFEVLVGALVAVLVWRGEMFRRKAPRGLLMTEDGERVVSANGTSFEQRDMEDRGGNVDEERKI